MDEHEALKYGDNGIGKWGAHTAQDHTPMFGLHLDHVVERWGSVEDGVNKVIAVRLGKIVVRGPFVDPCTYRDRVDCNPGALKVAGLRPGIDITAEWWWVDDESIA
jgi:hypothetical protein